MSDTNLPPEPATADVLDDLVMANRILARQGVVDVYGHISVRHPRDPLRYFMACSRAPALVTRDDLIEYHINNEPLNALGRPQYAERAIHGAIYAERPDVNSVCHNHAPPLIAFGVTDTQIRPIYGVGAVIGEHIPNWDIRDRFGDTNLLVTNSETGRSLAQCLGQARVALMRGHGSVVVGRGVREAVYVAVQLQKNAQIQLMSMALGSPLYLSPGEIKAAGEINLGTLSQNRSWELWAREIDFESN
jgi:ribulose-5-phosphate 4-epimerase/fuculose-1-phosphate aldolase